MQCRSGFHGQAGRAGSHVGFLAHEVDRDASASEIALGHQADHATCFQDFLEPAKR